MSVPVRDETLLTRGGPDEAGFVRYLLTGPLTIAVYIGKENQAAGRKARRI